jgi:hypothetical protein
MKLPGKKTGGAGDVPARAGGSAATPAAPPNRRIGPRRSDRRFKWRLILHLPTKFIGVWATFQHVDEAAATIAALHGQKRDYSVLTPCMRHELSAAMGDPQSKIPFITLFFGAAGLFVGYAFPSWTALDWVLPVSSKPIVGLPAFTIIGFEMMVLLGGLGTALTIFGLGFLDLLRKPLPKSERFKNYDRFSVDRFGIAVRCAQEEADAMEKLMKSHSAEEVVREY